MNLQTAINLAGEILPEQGVIEDIKMAAPPKDENSYIVQVRTHEEPPRVFWLGDGNFHTSLEEFQEQLGE